MTIEKQSLLLRLWAHDESPRTTWHPEGQNPGDRWFKTKAVKYVKRKEPLSKSASINKYLKIILAKESW